MKEDMLAHLRDRLLDERLKIARDNEAFDRNARTTPQESSGDLSHYPLHLADEGTDAVTQELTHSIASYRAQLFNHIDEALTRLHEDPTHFGTCENCGRQIPFDRLDAVPWATLCLPCEGKEEGSTALATRGDGND